MSRECALANINLEPTKRWAHSEYSLAYHKDYLAGHTGLAPDDPGLVPAGYDRFELDLIWSTNDGLVPWAKAGRLTNMGHASYAADGSDQHAASECPFKSEEEVWAFDAVEEYGLPDFDEQVRSYREVIAAARKNFPNQLTTGGYYKTIVSGAIQSFGWDMLLTAASDPVRMEPVFDSFFRRTLYHLKAWCETDVEVLIQHDDFVWSAGAFMHPDIYRKVIIPRYAELWKVVHEAGKKLLFCSDGNFMEFAADVVEAGADGLIFEPCNDFGFMVDHFGKTTCLVGSFVDCRDLTLGHWDAVRRDIDRTFEKLAECKGAIVAVGNHVPPNIPEAMMDKYFEYLLPKLERRQASSGSQHA